MRRDNVITILGVALLALTAWLDPGWRWFWATSAVVMAVWAIGEAIVRE